MDRSQIPLKVPGTFFVSSASRLVALALILIAPNVIAAGDAGAAGIPSFRFHAKTEPKLDPDIVTPGTVLYVFENLYRGLTRYVSGEELNYDMAERCRYKDTTEVHCTLRKTAKWSDGEPVTAQQFVDGFRHILSPESHCPVLDLLFTVKNAREAYLGKKKVAEIGITAVSPTEIRFDLNRSDNEFLEKLSNPLFVPLRPAKLDDPARFFFNGPYKVASWEKDRRLRFEANKYYPFGNPNRPPVEIVFAQEDAAAVSLYEKGIINFLWRVPSLDLPAYLNREDFHRLPQARLGYLGFNMKAGSPFEKKSVREAFARALNFEDLKKLFPFWGQSGCPGLGEPFLRDEGHCLEFVPKQLPIHLDKPVRYIYSQLGGDDMKRQAEWLQAQWQNHLGVKIEVREMEQKQLITALKNTPPDIFGKRIIFNRPTCLAAFESFRTDHPENTWGFSNLRFDKLADALARQKMPASERESICEVLSDILFKEEFVGIPMGRFFQAVLVNPKFTGWHMNELGQLDLAGLKYSQ